jgi:tetratricopeptide (TPR) repeat protein
MTETDTQLGGGYVYQWECAILLALNYFFQPAKYNLVLFDLIQSFLGRVGQIHLEGEDRERGVELEDINLIGVDGQRRVLIQVKTKQAEGKQWTPSDDLLLKSLYRFYTSPWFADDVHRDNTRFVFLTNRSFNRSLVAIKHAIRDGRLADCAEVGTLHGSLTRYAEKKEKDKVSGDIDRASFDRLLARTAFVEYLGLEVLKVNVLRCLQAYGRYDWVQAYNALYADFSYRSTRVGGGTVTRQTVEKVLGPPEGPLAAGMARLTSAITLPPPLRTFAGRDDLLDQLDALLQPGGQTAVGIVGLRGMAGVGKSALAVHAAYRWADRFPDGLVWVDLRTDDACGALRRIANLYGRAQDAAELGEDLPALADLARTILHNKRALLIFDNAEDLAAGELGHLLPGVHGPVTVVTSRKDFAALRRVGSTIRVDEMELAEALELFAEVLALDLAEIALPEDDQANPYRGLAWRLGCLPLALDIAARLMRERGWGPEVMLRRLEESADLPAALAHSLAEGPQDSVTLAFALSYESLDGPEQELFRALSPFAPAGFTPSAVVSVLSGDSERVGGERDGPEAAEVEATLERFESLSLVRRAAPPGHRPEVATYDLHPLLRDYAIALARGAGQLDLWVERHARTYLALARHHDSRLDGPDYLDALFGLDAAHPNLRAAWAAALAAESWELLRSFAYAVADYQDRRGLWAEKVRWAQEGIAACDRLDDAAGRAAMYNNLGNAYLRLPTGDRGENLGRAIGCYEEALRFRTPEAAPLDYAMTQNNLGNAYADLPTGDRGENLGRAIGCYKRALAIDHLPPWKRARYLRNLADAYRDLGEAGQAIATREQVLALARKMGDPEGEAFASWNLGRLFADSDPARAAELMQVCVDYEREVGHADAEADVQRVRELRERAAKS